VVDLCLFQIKDAESARVFKHTPRANESGFIDVELWFGQTTSGYSATGVRYLLDMPLGLKKLVDLTAQGNIFPADNLFGNQFENERSVTDPSIEIVWVNGVWAGDDDSSLMAGMFGSDENGGGFEADEPLRRTSWNHQVRCWPRDPIWRLGPLF